MQSDRRIVTTGACIIVLALGAGCARERPAEPAQNPPAVEHATTQVKAVKEPKCSLAWKAHGHTTQSEAKTFANACLTAEDGAVDVRMTPGQVRSKLATLLPPDHALPAMVPADIDTFCPGYAAASPAGRAHFWQELMTAMVSPESGYKTKTSYWEKGQDQYSLGLLQLSYNDKYSYRDASIPGCEFTTEAQVTDPDVNLQCAVKIMTKVVKKANVIGGDQSRLTRGGANYWSTLRMTSDARPPIIAATRSIPVCQQN
ncbi:hypothetical protein KL86PLE_90607 [uncultured Pleomorphomonas sp.]|uniref:Transglycosylase SLT domain-containing protein n=1 Tax=uncultured Pleomorphomonas sp. TaxID=442121 RepID=A0A212LQ53_9HYPH|nr:hypothetical protein [uncultured Pleomorphomonas sp.]SCM79725.1 hypothetical protein KL86PLE_90607 [uncultured Pleomorphomonas sp.]